MDKATLNGYIGRAKRISHTISWVNLRNEMRQAGATNEEILHVSRFLTKGSAKGASRRNPVTMRETPVKDEAVLLCDFIVADIDFMEYDEVRRAVLISGSKLNG